MKEEQATEEREGGRRGCTRRGQGVTERRQGDKARRRSKTGREEGATMGDAKGDEQAMETGEGEGAQTKKGQHRQAEQGKQTLQRRVRQLPRMDIPPVEKEVLAIGC